MRDSQQKTSENGGPSPVDQTEDIFCDLVERLKGREFKTLLEKCNAEFVAAEPATELTNDALEAIEQANTTERLQRRFEYARAVLKAAIKEKIESPDSELYKLSKEGLALLSQIEAGNNHLWGQLDAVLYSFIQICRSEFKKPSLYERVATWFKKIPYWIYILVSFLAALLAIFHHLGWLER